jgi:hypothetical protein
MIRKIILPVMILFACSFSMLIAVHLFLYPIGFLLDTSWILVPFMFGFAIGIAFGMNAILIFNLERCWP